ncbi:diacylglycerol/lipid kinase family protein [Salinilacihabitans rarus]|uniref:diacylglycerol/lipid kinase family protein n=1 Tax=Salinilacihabitans rarus TaxID=2961596 RepID=UPI0020C8755E|nr:YegS/Rv2252/BmrU family lipid kinase [Salinilacihabitans rarus]
MAPTDGTERAPTTGAPAGDEGRTIVVNPKSGGEDHVARVTMLGRERGFDVRRSEREGHAAELAREAAAAGADLVAAAGGDGTVNEVVNGLLAADALDRTALGVIPAGTGNNFATNVGIEGVDHAFEVIEGGERRDVDLGVTNERAFVNSCVGGVTAEASGATSPESKSQFGVLAYVKATLERVSEFDSIPLRVETRGDGADPWEGEAVFVLVGNCRRFTTARAAQANVEDGLFEVTIVERANAIDLVGEAALEATVGRQAENIVRRRAPSVTVEHRGDGAVEYSLDGEMLAAPRLSMATRPGALTVAVGEGYDPDPDAADG